LILPESAPGRVLSAARRGEVELVLSWELVEEIVDVLGRPKLARYEVDTEAVRALLRFFAPALPTVEVDVALRDPDDVHVIRTALAGGASAIVTGDRDLLADEEARAWLRERGVAVHTPTSLLAELGPAPFSSET
jgi:putative PIN family toxin of toxin-antitoxin system